MTSLWYAMGSGPPGSGWIKSERRRCPGSISFYLVRAFPLGPLAKRPRLSAQGGYCWTICIRRVGETNRGRVKDGRFWIRFEEEDLFFLLCRSCRNTSRKSCSIFRPLQVSSLVAISPSSLRSYTLQQEVSVFRKVFCKVFGSLFLALS